MISVIMSAYQEDLSVFVPAVTSILDQKGPSFELILVLDDPENTELASWSMKISYQMIVFEY